ncbi:MAG: ABC transporter ATP-binding protein [Christensenellales bacterium]|jgi:NitT/TauT family transport system ATP-binding protein
MIELRNISKSFDEKRVLVDVSYRFAPRAVTAITGRSGQGKTTVLNIILGLVKSDAGEVIAQKGLRYACVFQEDRLIEHMDARQNVQLTAHPAVDGAQIEDVLARLGLDPKDDERVARYSGGMRRRVAIARAVLAKPDVLALDEPFKGLDVEARAAAAELILARCPDALILLVTHDADEIALMRAEHTLELAD